MVTGKNIFESIHQKVVTRIRYGLSHNILDRLWANVWINVSAKAKIIIESLKP